MKSAPPEGPVAGSLPSQTVRNVATLLLFFHLFALLAAVFANPRDQLASNLLTRLGNVAFLRGYTEALWMEAAYDFFYTYGNVSEFALGLSTDYVADLELTYPDGRKEVVRIPDVGRFPGVRYQRYRNMLNNAASTIGRQGAESLMPAALTEAVLRSTGAASGTILVKRRLMQTMMHVSSPDPEVNDPLNPRYLQVVYTGYGQMRDGRFTYQKVEDAGGSSGSTAPTGTTPPTGTAPPATAAPPPATAAPPPATAAPPPSRLPTQGPRPR